MKITKVFGRGPHHNLVCTEDKQFAVTPIHVQVGSVINMKDYKKKVSFKLGEVLIGVDLRERVCDPRWILEQEQEAQRKTK